MGLSISYPQDDYLPLDDNMDRLFIRSLSFDDISGLESPPALLGKLIIEGSLSFKRREADPIQLETMISIRSPRSDRDNCSKPLGLSRFGASEERAPEALPAVAGSPKHEQAAVKLQKVYKSFRIRRQLADCAVLVEQRWWKLLDFAVLKRNSVSFFEIEKPETAISRWSRARIRAAKVGKGLSKDEKAQKLALQHWLEAIDPRHRYGHNLHFYYHRWLHCESKQPFFYWLDVGEGKEVSVEEHCPRWKLQMQCIKYLGPKERESYEVIVEDERLKYKLSRKILDTSQSPEDTKWIFVLSTSKILYVGQKKKGTFQHSSFLAGGATSAAGRLVVENGMLKAVWPHSGHYRPTEQNFQEFMSFLRGRNVDLTNVQLSPLENEEDSFFMLRSGHTQLDLADKCKSDKQEDQTRPACPEENEDTSIEAATDTAPAEAAARLPSFKRSSSANRLQKKRPPRLLLNVGPRRVNLATPNAAGERSRKAAEKDIDQDSSLFGECLEFCKENLFLENEEDEEVVVPKETILHRINSKKAMKSYQLGKQLSFRWTTGAGPRIGCVRDYPSELQVRALEQVSLSPRGTGPSRFSSPRPGPGTPAGTPTPR